MRLTCARPRHHPRAKTCHASRLFRHVPEQPRGPARAQPDGDTRVERRGDKLRRAFGHGVGDLNGQLLRGHALGDVLVRFAVAAHCRRGVVGCDVAGHDRGDAHAARRHLGP
eukprot:scaffold14737_cov68-Phaeocystis_antarctica.AAC.15